MACDAQGRGSRAELIPPLTVPWLAESGGRERGDLNLRKMGATTMIVSVDAVKHTEFRRRPDKQTSNVIRAESSWSSPLNRYGRAEWLPVTANSMQWLPRFPTPLCNCGSPSRHPRDRMGGVTCKSTASCRFGCATWSWTASHIAHVNA